MKKLCFVMIFALVLSSSAFAFAASAKTDNEAKTQGQKESTQTTASAIQTTPSAVQTTSAAVKTTPSAVDTKDQAKDKAKLTVAEKKELILKKYTSGELSAVNKAGEAIKKADSTVKILDVNSIVSDTKEFKFDTPPVIKGSRTLIPVRAITEGLGAKVSYDQATKKVTIAKDGTTIELTLGSNVALVNGKQVTLDTSANTMNDRTYVPMRFILETFNLKVSYEKDGTILVDESATAPTTTAPAATSSAIQTTTSAVQTTSAAVKTTTSAVETTSAAVKTTTSAIHK